LGRRLNQEKFHKGNNQAFITGYQHDVKNL